MRSMSWSVRRRLFDYFSPRLLPGAHRYCAVLDAVPRRSCIVDDAAFSAWANRMFPEGVTQ